MPKSKRRRARKTYTVVYTEDVCRYGYLDIEAASSKEAIEKAKAQDLDDLYFETESSEPFRREILRIDDENGKIIAEEIPLDEFFTGYGAEAKRLCDYAPELLAALKALNKEAAQSEIAFSIANLHARSVIAKVEERS